jgi:hypothetical protein
MATFRAFFRSSETTSTLELIIAAGSLVGGGVLWAS